MKRSVLSLINDGFAPLLARKGHGRNCPACRTHGTTSISIRVRNDGDAERVLATGRSSREERTHVRRFLIYELSARFSKLIYSRASYSPLSDPALLLSYISSRCDCAERNYSADESLPFSARSDRPIASFNGLCIRIQMISPLLSLASTPSFCSRS